MIVTGREDQKEIEEFLLKKKLGWISEEEIHEFHTIFRGERKERKREFLQEKNREHSQYEIRRSRKNNRKIQEIARPDYRCYFDGSCGPTNPGGRAGYGVLIYNKNEEEIWRAAGEYCPPKRRTDTSNNVAEYYGFLLGLQEFQSRALKDKPIMFYGDSRLVIYQMFGWWNIRNGLYTPLAKEAYSLVQEFTKISGKWIPREENILADALSKGKYPLH